MTRILVILMLIFAGVPRLGAGLAGETDPCAEAGCGRPAVPMSCCGGTSAEGGFCPMSNGPCVCVAAPVSDPEPRPEAPAPKSERDTVTGMSNCPPRVIAVIEPDSGGVATASRVLTALAGRSHNEVQALLGTWRT